jgi:hypothetical protein
MLGVEGAAQLVRAEDVEASVADERRHARQRVEHLLHGRPDLLSRTSAAPRGDRVRGAREIEQVAALSLVELERARERFHDAFGDAAEVAALEARVVVDGNPGEQRHLLPAETRNTAGAGAVGT